MARSQLRVYYGPQDDNCQTLDSPTFGKQGVTLSVADVLPLLADAVRSERTWLHDFDNDEITISSDLYDVLMAYQHFQRPGA
jgi:hypothetical protein